MEFLRKEAFTGKEFIMFWVKEPEKRQKRHAGVTRGGMGLDIYRYFYEFRVTTT